MLYFEAIRIPSDERMKDVVGLSDRGLSNRRIGESLGVHHATVGRDLKRTGANAAVENQQEQKKVCSDLFPNRRNRFRGNGLSL